MGILGTTAEEIVGTYGRSLAPDTPDAQRRVREALASVSRGIEVNGSVLELRRKNDDRPLWIEWWSRPAPAGNYTRTMFLDITQTVLAKENFILTESAEACPSEPPLHGPGSGSLIGQSAGLQKVLRQIRLVAPTVASVLITGESGTGKELVARAIHQQSPRKDCPLIKVNCSAVPESLFESEFFGHVKGAFTGAVKDRAGRFELADGGTLFLDEIGSMPLAMQAKLLRILQERELERVGGTGTMKIDVRIIAATNSDLTKEVDAGRFRQDLFYRLSVFPIEIPPLRERRDDIPLIAAHFVRETARRMNLPAPPITPETINQFTAYDWPGNVRELQNAVERAVILSQGGPLHFDLAASPPREAAKVSAAPSPRPALLTREDLKRQERENLAAALKQTGGKIFGPNGAAELLGMRPTTLASRIRALGINRKDGREQSRPADRTAELTFHHLARAGMRSTRPINTNRSLPFADDRVVAAFRSLPNSGARDALDLNFPRWIDKARDNHRACRPVIAEGFGARGAARGNIGCVGDDHCYLYKMFEAHARSGKLRAQIPPRETRLLGHSRWRSSIRVDAELAADVECPGSTRNFNRLAIGTGGLRSMFSVNFALLHDVPLTLRSAGNLIRRVWVHSHSITKSRAWRRPVEAAASTEMTSPSMLLTMFVESPACCTVTTPATITSAARAAWRFAAIA